MAHMTCRILTTTACNAHCVYCYEKGIPAQWMDSRTADQTADFIIARTEKKDDVVSLEWFGGEPTLNPEAADRVCERLRSLGIPYRSSMVTNGLLLDTCLNKHRFDLWNLKKVQITLDGSAPYHETVKGFATGAFDRILQNVITLTNFDILVKLRLNYGDNVEESERLIDTLGDLFSGNTKVFTYIQPIYIGEKAFSEEIMHEVLKLNERLIRVGLSSEKALYAFSERGNRCFMMTPDGFTIGPDGRLYNCSHNMTDEQCVGSVWQYDGYNPVRQMFLQGVASEECTACSAFWICKGGCRIGELGLAQMPQCHPYKTVLSEISEQTQKTLI